MVSERAGRATGAPSDSGEGPDEASERTAVRTVAVGEDRTVAYAEYGAPNGAPVVFFHGTPGSHVLGELYDEAARRRGVRVLAIERPGYGDSAPRPGRTPTDAEYLHAVLDDVGVSTVGIVAFSGGAAHALALGASREEVVTEIDVVSGATPPSFQTETPLVVRLLGAMAGRTPRLLTGLLGVQARLAERGPASVVVGQYTADGGDEIPGEAAEIVRRDFVRALDARREGMLTESEQAVREWEFAPTDVTVPVRLWHGGRDANVPVEGARRLAETIPSGDLTVFESADHLSTLLRSRSPILDRHAPADGDS